MKREAQLLCTSPEVQTDFALLFTEKYKQEKTKFTFAKSQKTTKIKIGNMFVSSIPADLVQPECSDTQMYGTLSLYLPKSGPNRVQHPTPVFRRNL